MQQHFHYLLTALDPSLFALLCPNESSLFWGGGDNDTARGIKGKQIASCCTIEVASCCTIHAEAMGANETYL
jgi:hypothetical protein